MGSYKQMTAQYTHRCIPCPLDSPGFRTIARATDMDLTYHEKFELGSGPDAYTRLILDVLRGEQATFVRDDELEGACGHDRNRVVWSRTHGRTARCVCIHIYSCIYTYMHAYLHKHLFSLRSYIITR